MYRRFRGGYEEGLKDIFDCLYHIVVEYGNFIENETAEEIRNIGENEKIIAEIRPISGKIST